MHHFCVHPRRNWPLLAALVAFALMAVRPAMAQRAPDGPVIELDMEALLMDPSVFDQVAEDEIWRIEPRPARRLLQLPLVIIPGPQTAEVGRADVDVKGASLLAFRMTELPPDIEPRSREAAQLWLELEGKPLFAKEMSIDPKTGRVTYKVDRFPVGGEVKQSDHLYAMYLDRQLLQDMAPDPPGQGGNRNAAPNRGGNRNAAPNRGGNRRGGATRGGNRNVAPNRGGNQANDRARELEEMMRYREEVAEFNTLRRQVGDLPGEITIPMPRLVWGVFDITLNQDVLEFESSSGTKWSIELKLLQALRDEVDRGPVRENDRESVQREMALEQMLGQLVDAEHPYSKRLAAYTLVETGLAGKAQIGQSLFLTMRKLLESDDDITRRVLIQELASMPPTAASTSLLKMVVREGVDASVVSAKDIFGSLFKDAENNPGRISEILTETNRMLADPNGPPPAQIIETIVSEAQDTPSLIPALARGLRFQGLDERRLRDALLTIIELAGTEPLAAGWLDQQFLGAGDPQLVRLALSMIVDAETGSRSLGPFVRWMMDESFGEPKAEEGAGFILRKAKLSARIPIDSARHGMFRALLNSDLQVRRMAWQALPNFVMAEPPSADRAQDRRQQNPRFDRRNPNARPTGRPGFPAGRPDMEPAGRPGFPTAQGGATADAAALTPADDAPRRYQILLDAALDQVPTPTSVVDFLSHQPQQRLATDGLVQIVLRGTSDASAAASRALLGSAYPVGESLLAQSFGERQGFAMRMYDNIEGEIPLAVNILHRRMDKNPMVAWFGDQVSAGNLPAVETWYDAFEGGEEELLRLAAVHDTEMSKGALAILIAAAGGDPSQAEALAPAFTGLEDRSLDALKSAWNDVRKEILLERVEPLTGPYDMILRVYEAGDATRQPMPQARSMPARPGMRGGPARQAADSAQVSPAALESANLLKEVPLGVVQLAIQGDQVTLGVEFLNVSLPADSNVLQLRLDQIASLKSFPHDQLAELDLDKVKGALNLAHQRDGTWDGAFQFPGGRLGRVTLAPVPEEGEPTAEVEVVIPEEGVAPRR